MTTYDDWYVESSEVIRDGWMTFIGDWRPEAGPVDYGDATKITDILTHEDKWMGRPERYYQIVNAAEHFHRHPEDLNI